MLRVDSIHTYYGDSHILDGVSLSVDRGQVVSLLGRNGMGKTTAIHSIMGLVSVRAGSVFFEGQDITRLPPHAIARLGLGLVPQGRRIFPSLSVEENLRIVQRKQREDGPWGLTEVYELFPRLRERRSHGGANLSGGEQQMLALGRALMTNPKILLLDEPSEGLAPSVVQQLARTIMSLRDAGMTILLVEQIVPLALAVSDFVYVLARGGVAHASTPAALKSDSAAMHTHLGVGKGDYSSEDAV